MQSLVMKRASRLVSGTLAAVLVLGACGSDDDAANDSWEMKNLALPSGTSAPWWPNRGLSSWRGGREQRAHDPVADIVQRGPIPGNSLRKCGLSDRGKYDRVSC